jgi:hypothetical protein
MTVFRAEEEGSCIVQTDRHWGYLWLCGSLGGENDGSVEEWQSRFSFFW